MSLEKKYDAVVVGLGAAGYGAALRLCEKNKKVLVIGSNPGATSMASGAWDLFDDKSIRMLLLRRKMNNTGLNLLLQELCDPGILLKLMATAGGYVDWASFDSHGYELATSMGTWKKTHGADKIQTRMDRNKLGKQVAVVGSKSFRFMGREICHSLSTKENDLTYVDLDFPKNDHDISLMTLAVWLRERVDFRNQFIDCINQQCKGFDAVLFPPLFLSHDIFNEIIKNVSNPCGELLSTSEPIAGLRDDELIHRKTLAHADFISSKVEHFEIENGSIRAALLQNKKRIEAQSFIIATGGILSGALQFGYETIHEPLLNLPVFSGGLRPIGFRSQLYGAGFSKRFQDESWNTLGLYTNTQFQVVGENNRVVYPNLYACGSLLGGIDFEEHGMGRLFHLYSGIRCADVL